MAGFRWRFHGVKLEAEGVFTGGNHDHGERGSIGIDSEIFGLEPGAEPGIVDLRLILPEIGRQAALDPQMIQVQLDGGGVPGEVAPDIVHAYVKSDDSEAFFLRFDHHGFLLFLGTEVSVGRSIEEASFLCREIPLRIPLWNPRKGGTNPERREASYCALSGTRPVVVFVESPHPTRRRTQACVTYTRELIWERPGILFTFAHFSWKLSAKACGVGCLSGERLGGGAFFLMAGRPCGYDGRRISGASYGGCGGRLVAEKRDFARLSLFRNGFSPEGCE